MSTAYQLEITESFIDNGVDAKIFFYQGVIFYLLFVITLNYLS